MSSLQPGRGILLEQKWAQGKAMHLGRARETLEDFFKSIFTWCVLPTYLSVPPVYAWRPMRAEEDLGSPGTGVRNDCELPCGAVN